MEFTNLIERPGIKGNEKLNSTYNHLGALLAELSNKNLPDEIVNTINKTIAELNSIPDSDKGLTSQIKKKQYAILRTLEKELKIVTKNHYRNTWLAVGMTAIGLPIGLAFSMSLGNMAFLGLGLPIGLAIGIGVGTKLDLKAAEEGRQLDSELKF